MKQLWKQLCFFEEMLIDNFAGGGGASTGIELATGRPVDAAVNHDPDAILMHKTNHPYTRHYCESVWDVNPWEVTRGRPVGLAWFSPDCKHFSKAKGSKPVNKNIRGLAWIVLKWAGTVRPRVIILENVEEFQTWGPVRKGRPVKSKQGETFHKWKSQLQGLGYVVDHRELVAADYGAPTIRKRFFLIARCDGKPIVWPERTHAPRNSEEVKNGMYEPWRSAAEIINWSLPCPSIFDTREEIKEKYNIQAVRPLAINTQRRIARGIDKFVLQNNEPFIVQVNHKGNQFRGQSMEEPLPTITGKHGYGIATPVMTAIGQTGFADGRSYQVEEPTRTSVSKAEQCLLMPSIIQYHTEQSEKVRGQELAEPIMTLDAANRYGLSAAYLAEYYGNAQDGLDPSEPLHTVTAKDREGVVKTFLSKFYKTGIGQELSEPLHTITTSPGHFGAVRVEMKVMLMEHVKRCISETISPLSMIFSKKSILRDNYGILFAKCDAGELHHWPEIREMLNKYCDYEMAEDEVLLLNINGILHFISDIGLRMLTPRELYNANGFPSDYVIDHDYTGKEYGKAKQVARCGNAVPPPFAEALVRANLPELCGKKVETMEELKETMIS